MPSAPKPRVKEYVRPMPADWWLKHPAYLRFMLRELSSAFLAGYAIFLMVLLVRAREDLAAFSLFVDSLRSPISLLLHAVVLFFALFNTLTTFNLAPRVLVVHRGEERVPDAVIAGVHYAAWAVVSAALIVLAFKL